MIDNCCPNLIKPGSQVRGRHAYKELKEVIVALSGSFDVVLDDGKETKIYSKYLTW